MCWFAHLSKDEKIRLHRLHTLSDDSDNEKIIDMFWDEYNAYALRDFKKNGYYYDKKPLEAAVIRTLMTVIVPDLMNKERRGD